MEALLCYCKIEVNKGTDKASDEPTYKNVIAADLEKELTTNHKLISMTNGREDGESSGSDSEPSADNLEEDELAKFVPIIKAKEKKKPPVVEKPKIVPPVKPLPPPKSPEEKKRPIIKEIVRTTDKKKGFNAFDRLSIRGKRKPEMKDAWTQTSPKSKEQLEQEKREHRQRK